MTDRPSPVVDLINAFIAQTVPSLTALGIEVTEAEVGRASSRLPFARNCNHFGAMYAGSMFCCGEVLAAALLAPSFDFAKAYPLVKSMEIAYRRPARTDVIASAELDADELGRIARDLEANGKADWHIDVTLRDLDGDVAATMSGACQIRAVGT